MKEHKRDCKEFIYKVSLQMKYCEYFKFHINYTFSENVIDNQLKLWRVSKESLIV